MNVDNEKAPLYILVAVLVIVGIGFIWRWITFERFRSPEEHGKHLGTYYSGGWITLVQGIVMAVIGFALLFMFG